ncbi:MAG: S9 family peptidase [Planctomycetota bacterium]
MDVPLIPREVLFGNPERVSPELSPDGTRLAYIAPDEGVLNVWVRTVGKDDDRAVTRDRDRGIRDFSWAENGRDLLYVQDRDGDENWHLYQVPADGGDERDLTPVDGIQARIVAADKSRPDTILVGMNDRNEQLHDVYRVDLATGERELVLENGIGSIDWVADRDLVVRVATLPTPDGGFQHLIRDGEGAEWKELAKVDPDDAMGSQVLGFSRDGTTLYLTASDGANAAELRAYDVATGGVTTLASDDTADVESVVFDPETKTPQAVVYWRARQDWEILDDAIAADVANLGKITDGDFHVIDRDRADRQWLVAHSRDRSPVVYHHYDRDTGEATFLFSARPQLEGLPLAEMIPISYEARDGLTIHGYLTLPVGVEPKNLPTVLNIHGGPWHRDVWGLHPEQQWLANRGYASLQINFRGSTGYGKDFVNAGDREWGGKMQDDISDGVAWLIEEGYSDPEKIAIYGGSYGGYAVLAGMTFTPELYACGVDIVGPSNLITFSTSIPPYWEPLRALFQRRVGNFETEEEFLRERSPLFSVDEIRAPLYIAQGKNDPRVKVEESLQIVAALEKAGKTVKYIEFPDEGHGFAKPENRLTHYAAAEAFLAEHLGGRSEPA